MLIYPKLHSKSFDYLYKQQATKSAKATRDGTGRLCCMETSDCDRSWYACFLGILKFLGCSWTVFLTASFNRFLMICSANYFSSGINKWRDSRTPRQILEKYCEVKNFFKPRFLGNDKVIFHGDEFFLEDFGKLAGPRYLF